MSTLLLHKSVIVYVRVIMIGQVPVTASEKVTTKAASAVQLSEIVKPNPSKAATVVTAVGASVATQPTIGVTTVPVATGAILSSIVTV